MRSLLPLSQTTNPWNPSPRITWQTHQPACSACYCTYRATITLFITTPIRKWPCLTHSVSSVHALDLTSASPHYPQLNGFTEACVKSVKHALQCAKYSGAHPQLALLVLWATPIDAKLPSPAELLYQCQIRTTIPARMQHQPSSPSDLWTNWCPLQCLQVTGRQMMEIPFTPVCQPTCCDVWHPP